MNLEKILENSLKTENHKYFHIEDLTEWSKKVLSKGHVEYRTDEADGVISYVAYYKNKNNYFITMVWTHPNHRGKGLSKKIIKDIVDSTELPIDLEVHKDNPAYNLYRILKFETVGFNDDQIIMRRCKKLAIMQPYIFPYVGYFSLINSSDKILFYDDVNFIKRGWIHRQRILINSKDHLFTIPLNKPSQNKKINQIEISENESRVKIIKSIESAYKKAPYFKEVFPIIEKVILGKYTHIDEMAISSLVAVCKYLNLEINYDRTSKADPDSQGQEKCERLASITKTLGFSNYVNVINDMYDKETFKTKGVNLFFNDHKIKSYNQFGKPFVSHLSIIDVLMFNSIRDTKKLILSYHIV